MCRLALSCSSADGSSLLLCGHYQKTPQGAEAGMAEVTGASSALRCKV